MVKNPEWFDVIVTENLMGDIITDLAAMTAGGMGISSGGNINPEGVSMFEPIGGSAPKYTGLNVINPMAAIGAGAMTVSHANDSYFWVVTNFGEMTPDQGYRTQTVLTLVLGVSSMIGIFILSLIF